MPQRGEILIERLTGKRVIVIRSESEGEEVICRFADGRLEERFAFELDKSRSLADTLAAFFASVWSSSQFAIRTPPPRPARAMAS